MLADKGYDSDDVRTNLLLEGILPVIPPKANRKQAVDFDFRAYEERNRVERWFNEFKHLRRNVTDPARQRRARFLHLWTRLDRLLGLLRV
jgi:transposase